MITQGLHADHNCCRGESYSPNDIITLAAEVPTGFAKYIEKLARDMWNRKATEAGFEPELVKTYGDQLSKAVTKGYGKDVFEMDWNEPDYNKLKNLHIDAWKFATGKSTEHLNMLTKALRKPDGSMRTFEEFRIQTVIATGKQLRGLRAEYNTAVASAQMASKWEEIQRMKETYPYLEFVAVMDNHVTEKCARLDGVIKHVDDPFWLEYYPPNHYNCRSTVKQLRKIPEGYRDPWDQEPDVPEQFKTDFIQQGHLFPADHKYYQLTPNELFNKVRQHLPYDLQFDKIEHPDFPQARVREHYAMKHFASDYADRRQVAFEMSTITQQGFDLLPEIDDPRQREIIMPEAKELTNADYKAKGLLLDLKSPNSTRYRTLANNIDVGYKQVNHVILNLTEEITMEEMIRVVNSRFKEHADLKRIYFRYQGRYWYSRGVNHIAEMIEAP